MSKFLLFVSLLFISACTDVWSERARDGTRLSDAMPVCQAKASASADHQFRFNNPARIYLEGTNDTRQDIARRETALCLKNKGFSLSRQ